MWCDRISRSFVCVSFSYGMQFALSFETHCLVCVLSACILWGKSGVFVCFMRFQSCDSSCGVIPRRLSFHLYHELMTRSCTPMRYGWEFMKIFMLQVSPFFILHVLPGCHAVATISVLFYIHAHDIFHIFTYIMYLCATKFCYVGTHVNPCSTRD